MVGSGLGAGHDAFVRGVQRIRDDARLRFHALRRLRDTGEDPSLRRAEGVGGFRGAAA